MPESKRECSIFSKDNEPYDYISADWEDVDHNEHPVSSENVQPNELPVSSEDIQRDKLPACWADVPRDEIQIPTGVSARHRNRRARRDRLSRRRKNYLIYKTYFQESPIQKSPIKETQIEKFDPDVEEVIDLIIDNNSLTQAIEQEIKKFLSLKSGKLKPFLDNLANDWKSWTYDQLEKHYETLENVAIKYRSLIELKLAESNYQEPTFTNHQLLLKKYESAMAVIQLCLARLQSLIE